MTVSRQKNIIGFSGWPVIAALVACLLAWAGPASAVTVPGLYSAEVPVSSTSAGALREGYADGLRQVMVRVSGSRDVLERDGVEDLLGDAESMLLSYQVGSTGGQSRLQMSFGAVGVNRALASIGAPVWGANRPLTLAWVAVEDRGDRNLLTSGADNAGSAWRGAFQAAAAVRGLPVTFPPAATSGDRALMSDLWGQFVGRIQQASGDISHDVLALVRISRSGGQWRAGWVVDGMGMDAAERSVSAASPEALAQAVVDHWAEQYAGRYAVAPADVSESPKVDIMLEGVATLADYGQVSNALDRMTPVVAVGASRVRGERLTAQVTFTGELDQLKEYIALDPRFVPLDGVPEPRQEDTDETTTESPDDNAVDEPEKDSSPGYQELAEGDEQDAEQAFESLYQVLYYRWQPASVVGRGDGG